jgi:hypothetical protein
MLMRVGRDGRNAVTLGHAQFRKSGAPLVVSFAKLGVRKPQFAVDHGFALAVQFARAARELEGCQRRFHRRKRTRLRAMIETLHDT